MEHDLATIRAGLERLLQSTADRHHQLEQREQELAAAMELLAVDPRVQAAYNDGAAEARRRVQLLIQLQSATTTAEERAGRSAHYQMG